MVNPGTFRGTRKEFLKGELLAYARAVEGGYVLDGVALISRRYFKRYPVDIPLDQEPTPEHLAAVDNDAIEPDEPPIDDKELSIEDFIEEGFRQEEHAALVAYRQALTGKGYKLPRLKAPFNLWRVGERDEISRLAKLEPGFNKKNAAATRDRIAKNLFDLESPEEKEEWSTCAAELYDEEKIKYDWHMKEPPSTRPEDCQIAIQGFSKFSQNICDLIAGATGLKVLIIAGGPEPAHGGRLQVISVHSGTTTGNVKMNFGRFERVWYKKYLVPIFGNFLKNCYSPEECQSRALPDNSGFEPLDKMDLGDDVNVDGIEMTTVTSLSVSISSHASSVVISSMGKGNATGALTRPPFTNIVPTPRPRSALSNAMSNRMEASASSIMPISMDASATATAIDMSSTLPMMPTEALLVVIPSGSTVGAVGTGDDNDRESGEGKDDAGIGEPGTESPILGFPSLFDLPPSPVLDFDELPVSRFASPEHSPDDPPPAAAPISAPAAAPISAPVVSAPAISPDTTPGLKREQPVTNKPVTVPEEDSEHGHSANKRPRRSNTRGTDICSVATGTEAREKVTIARKDEGSRRDIIEKSAAMKDTVMAGDDPSAAKGASSSSASASVVDPPWLKSALTMLKSEEFGGGWKALVQAWVNFKRKEGNHPSSVLGSSHRPAAVCDWIQRARSPSYRPAIKSTSEFQATFAKWWERLQPDWRLSASGEVIVSELAGDWGGLRKAGRNGILSVMAALFFWGFSLKGMVNAEHEGWRMATDDCLRVLNTLTK